MTSEYFETLFDHAHVPNIMWGPSATITRFNHAFEEFTGQPAAEMVGRKLSVLFPEETRDESLRMTERTLDGEHRESVKIPIRHRSGKTLVALWNSANVYAEDGTTVVATIAQGIPITERKRAEKRLHRSEEHYRAIIEHSNDFIWSLDAQGNFTFVNHRAEEATGYVVEDWLGKSFAPMVRPEQLPGITEVFRKTLRGTPQQYEVDVVGKDGSIVALSVNTTPIREGSEITGTVSFGTDITERVQAQAALERRATQLTTLSEVGQQITVLLELDPLLDRIVSRVHDAFDYRYVSFLLIDPDTGDLTLSTGAGYDVRSATPLHIGLGTKGIVGWVATNGEPLLVDDVSLEPRFLAVDALPDTRSELAVPIRIKGRILGVLDVQSTELGAFHEEDLRTLKALADQVAIAIENARLYEQSQQEIASRKATEETLLRVNRSLKVLSECNQAVVRAVDESSLLREICRILVDIGEYHMAWVGFAETGEEKRVLPAAQAGYEDEYLDTLHVSWACNEHGRGPTGRAIRTGEPVVLRDISSNPKYGNWRVEAAERGYTSAVALPLSGSDGSRLGAVTIYAEEVDAFDAEEVRLLGELTDDLAYGIEALRTRTEREQAEEALRRERDLAEALAAATASLTATVGFDKALDRILEQVSRIVPNDAANIMFIEGDQARVVRGRGYEQFGAEDSVPTVLFSVSEVPNLRRMLETGEPLAVPDIAADSDWLLIEPAQEWLRSHAGAPITMHGEVIGFLNVDSTTPDFYNEGHAAALLAFADHAAAAIEGARLYEEVQQELSERKRAEEELELSFVRLAETVSRAIESQDPYTAGHQRQVADLATTVGERMGLDKDRLQGLYVAGLLHDIGKISIPSEILTQPGKLSNAEWALIRTHPRHGHEILRQAEFPWPVADIALRHHERLDGSGYPDGLTGDRLTLEVRILAVCDVVDAMSSDRPYRSSQPTEEVLRELRGGSAGRYDATVVAHLLAVIEKEAAAVDD